MFGANPQVKPPESVKPRYWHSVTATWLGPGLTEVLMFGGCQEWPDNWENEEEFTPIADTTILRFGERAYSVGCR